VTRRDEIVRQRSRLKNIIRSILYAHLILSRPHQNLCGPQGPGLAFRTDPPGDERLAVECHLRGFATGSSASLRVSVSHTSTLRMVI
jgi:hypothetical protein